MSVLVDSSVWIDYFRDEWPCDTVDMLIEENLIVTNQLILAEIIPPPRARNMKQLIALLRAIKRQPMRIDWETIILLQTTCLRNGINGVGIADLIVAQNAVQGELRLLTNDKHFALISEHIPLELYR